ncbi:Uncharacterised protein [Vibrio cholerae]|nr:Uncharacterised protein [Vibrio cholerae]
MLVRFYKRWRERTLASIESGLNGGRFLLATLHFSPRGYARVSSPSIMHDPPASKRFHNSPPAAHRQSQYSLSRLIPVLLQTNQPVQSYNAAFQNNPKLA